MRRTFMMINALMVIGIIMDRSSSWKAQDPLAIPHELAEQQILVPIKPQHLTESSGSSKKSGSEIKAHPWVIRVNPHPKPSSEEEENSLGD